jgi:hypothetical protein
MRTLKVWMVVLVMLAVCVPSALCSTSVGHILIYNTISRVKAVDSETSSLVGKAVRGYLVIDVNEAGDINEAYWFIYGRDGEGAKIYSENWIDLDLSVDGKYQSISMETAEGWFVTVVGKITSKDIGFTDNKQQIAYSMSGNFIIPDGFVLDSAEALVGSGAVVITLNSTKTKAANAALDSIDDVLADLEDVALAGYTGV